MGSCPGTELEVFTATERGVLLVIKVDLCSEGLAYIAREDLKITLRSLKNDLKLRKAGRWRGGLFYSDKAEDVAEIKRHIEAFKIVLKYYGG